VFDHAFAYLQPLATFVNSSSCSFIAASGTRFIAFIHKKTHYISSRCRVARNRSFFSAEVNVLCPFI